MRIVPLLLMLSFPVWGDDLFGVWKVAAAQPMPTYPRIVLVRIEPHAKGGVLTVDRVDRGGLATTDSTILYLDGNPRDYQGAGCSGTQSSRRLDVQAIEIVRNCGKGAWTRFVGRSSVSAQMTFEITGQHADGRKFECRLLLQKQ